MKLLFFNLHSVIGGLQSIPWELEDKDTAAILVGMYNII